MRTSFPIMQAILIVHIVTIVSTILNMQIIRQVSGFVYLMFVPGFVILKILKSGERDLIGTILFSVGLSIAFSMFSGLVINEFYPLIGISEPLSTSPLLITMMAVTIVLLFVGYRSNLERIVNVRALGQMTSKTLLKAFLFVLPPIFGIIGALYNNTNLLLLMIAVVAISWALIVFSRKFLPAELYPLAIFAIGLGLLLHISLISKYNLGCDINPEYYTFKLTEIQGYWKTSGFVKSPTQIASYQSDLSVTILPTIYSVILDISGELIFKLIFAFILTLIPLVIYQVCELQTGKLYAVLSAFLFMSTPYSFIGTEPLGVERQIIATFFLMLSVLLIVDKKMALGKRKILFITFGLALIVSHYSIAYIYLLYVAFTFILSYRHRHNGIVRPPIVLFLISGVFLWYVFVSDSPMLALTANIENMYRSFFADMFNPAARSSTVFYYLNPSTASSVVGLIYRLLVYLQNFFIVVGILMLLVKRKETSFTREYQLMSILSMLILMASLVVPRFAPALNFTRFYGITLLFLAPFFVLGGVDFFEFVKKTGAFLLAKFRMLHHESWQLETHRNLSLKFMTVVLIVTFLFEIGFVNHITGSDPISLPLDLDRRKTTTNLASKISFYEVYTPEQDVFSARWYSSNTNQESQAYADYLSKENVLTAYALAERDRIRILSNDTVLPHGTYVYLRLLNVYDNTLVTDTGLLKTSQISSLLNESNKIYSNGASEIYLAP